MISVTPRRMPRPSPGIARPHAVRRLPLLDELVAVEAASTRTTAPPPVADEPDRERDVDRAAASRRRRDSRGSRTRPRIGLRRSRSRRRRLGAKAYGKQHDRDQRRPESTGHGVCAIVARYHARGRLMLLIVLFVVLGSAAFGTASAQWQPAAGPLRRGGPRTSRPIERAARVPAAADGARATGRTSTACGTTRSARARSAAPATLRRPDPRAVSGRVRAVRRDEEGRRDEPALVSPDVRRAARRGANGADAAALRRVDWDATVCVNGKTVGTHRGGYDAFTFDITDALQTGRTAGARRRRSGTRPTPARSRAASRSTSPSGIWYTPVTGIWQTVWLEPVPDVRDRLARRSCRTSTRARRRHATVASRREPTPGDARSVAVALDGTREVGRARGALGQPLALPVPNAKLWSPDSPSSTTRSHAVTRGRRPSTR